MRAIVIVLSAMCASASAAALVEPWSTSRVRALCGQSKSSENKLVRRLVGRFGFGTASRKARSAARVRVLQALTALASELEAGQPPLQALASAGGSPSVWPRATAACEHGEVVDALRADGAHDRVVGLLAACWEVGADSGAGLAAAVARLAASARAQEDTRAQLEAHLAAPRASARMLGLLPVVGLGLGMMLGAEPLAWLISTAPGVACLVAGIALTALGFWWTSRIAAGVEARL